MKNLRATFRNNWLNHISICLTFITSVACSERNEARDHLFRTHDKEGVLWTPYLEWSIKNSSYEGNPFDVIADVLFIHNDSNETRKTQMFYDGDKTWKFRFTGTKVGLWQLKSSSVDPELNNISGKITILRNRGTERGFVASEGNKWTRSADEEGRAFIPQFVMYSDPHLFYENNGKIDKDIRTFLIEHGFSGFHVGIYCRWFDIYGTVFRNHRPKCGGSYRDPDIRTFAAIENLILKTYKAGGVVHLWAWGDDERQHNAKYLEEGINGSVDQRLQRYIAARLGPIPGWSMGYGFDLHEWVNTDALNQWYRFMHDKMFWPHMLGARAGKNKLNQLSELMDYSGYEQHRPDYDMYVKTILARPNKPSFSEDRFRVVPYRPDWLEFSKHYSSEEIRKGLWHSAMAGGVANIWGNISELPEEYGSTRFENAELLKTYSRFFEHRFFVGMVACNKSDGTVCLKQSKKNRYIFFAEETDTLKLDLSEMSKPQVVIAVDSKRPYEEIALDKLGPGQIRWHAPYVSDWAIAVGEFPEPKLH